MALSGLDIYKLLPRTNCKECGFATCLAFAMQLAKKAVGIDKCPHLTADARALLEASSLPPIRLVTVGTGERTLAVGNETVLFRHEEKFHNPAGIGFIIDDSLSEAEIRRKADRVNALEFERVGQKLSVNLIAVRQTGSAEKFLAAVRCVSGATTLGLVLMSKDAHALKGALELVKSARPLLYPGAGAGADLHALAVHYRVPLVASASDIQTLSELTGSLVRQGIQDLVIETGSTTLAGRIGDLTQIRRQALKKSQRALGYPVIVSVDLADPYEEAIAAATYIAKYAGIVLLRNVESAEALALLTLRQNLYTDPQKPLQIEPKLYAVGPASESSPVLVTTNFSLTYYTVLGEVEASKVGAYIATIDTEGMSVLTAWAAEKFTPGHIVQSLAKFEADKKVSRRQLILPGYVAVMSGELEESSGWQVVVGPKEAAGIPSFLKNLS